MAVMVSPIMDDPVVCSTVQSNNKTLNGRIPDDYARRTPVDSPRKKASIVEIISVWWTPNDMNEQ